MDKTALEAGVYHLTAPIVLGKPEGICVDNNSEILGLDDSCVEFEYFPHMGALWITILDDTQRRTVEVSPLGVTALAEWLRLLMGKAQGVE